MLAREAASGRVAVKLDRGGVKALKPGNLKVLGPHPDAGLWDLLGLVLRERQMVQPAAGACTRCEAKKPELVLFPLAPGAAGVAICEECLLLTAAVLGVRANRRDVEHCLDGM